MKKIVETWIPTGWGRFKVCAYAEREDDPMPHLAIVHENYTQGQTTYVRMHSECLTGDLLGSRRCDCGKQLDKALKLVAEKGGVVIYLRQEGRGIGLINKLKAYNHQDEGMNTAEANTHMGFEVDARNYQVAVEIMTDLGINRIHLMTNNPDKIEAIQKSSINIVSRVPILTEPVEENASYLKTKKELMGHILGQ